MTDLYVPGIPGAVSRYYVCSERLRDRGWQGVGDYRWMPGQRPTGFEDTLTFAEALSMTGIGRFYDWQITKLFAERLSVTVRADITPALNAMAEAAHVLGRSLETIGETRGGR